MGFYSKKIHKYDPHAPRLGKGEFSKILVSKDLWKKAVKANPDFANMSWKEFWDIWCLIGIETVNEIAENPLGVKLPFFLGEWKVQYLPYKPKTQDNVTSAEIGDIVPYLNIHSKGKVCSIIWERKDARRYNSVLDLYAFEEDKKLTLKAAEAVNKNPDKYRVSRVRVNNRENPHK